MRALLLVCQSNHLTGFAKSSEISFHGTCVAYLGKGLLIRGASASGKSALALTLMAWGAELVADDCTLVNADNSGLWASAPEQISGLIEARGIGLLRARPVSKVQLSLVVDLDQLETERLPRHQSCEILGYKVPVLARVDEPHLAPALLQYLKAGALDPDDCSDDRKL